MSSVAHELRSPLTSILGYLDLAKDEEQTLSKQMVLFLGAVNRNAARLLLLVTDLLSASAAERAPMRLVRERTDLARLAQLSVEDATPRASEAGVSIALDAGPGVEVDADPNRLLQVLDNLLSNAVKFSPPGGHVVVTVQRAGTEVDLVVRDTGVGIDAESLQHVGTKFFRARNATAAAIPGLGLGVMITKTIVEAHGGTLTFDSREGSGTTVRVALPKPSGSPVSADTAVGSSEPEPAGPPL
jgi:two-component system phosphate regulon sensor histidine kinase PhoR